MLFLSILQLSPKLLENSILELCGLVSMIIEENLLCDWSVVGSIKCGLIWKSTQTISTDKYIEFGVVSTKKISQRRYITRGLLEVNDSD